ncbi:MAG: amino acid permease [Rhodospirillaceae bacterium]|jgi:ethanolamine permease|nr:amino acid permease [Rhodospirillaceae bacterium]
MADTTVSGGQPTKINLVKVLGPVHVWALGVGIVLVGEFMGWNYSVEKGGALGSLIACWIIGLLYTCVAMLDSEVTSTVAAAGGQYTQAKHTTGPLMAFNVGLYLVLAYTMLEAADIFVFGDLIRIAAEATGAAEGTVDARPFVLLAVSVLAFLNYRGVFMALSVNFLITAVAFASIVILFFAYQFGIGTGEPLQHGELGMGTLPYGWMGVLAAFQFAIWYYLGIEGTCQAAEEVRSCGRSLPLGTMTGMITLLIAAALTWYVASGMLPWEYLGTALAPLYDTALMSGSQFLIVLLWVGTVFSALASANGCINDAARAWFSMGRDRYLPEFFAAVHPKYRTPYRSIIFLIPIAAAFGFLGLLAPVITFSILSGLLGYTFMPINMFRFRSKWPLGSIKRGYVHPFHPLPAIVLIILCTATYVAVYLGFGTQLLAMMLFYIVASVWFVFFRYKYVRRGDQFTMAWPRPNGY